jgi:hypothetical protein
MECTQPRGRAVEVVLAALEEHGSRVHPREGYHLAQCPAHLGTAALIVSRNRRGVTLTCHAGCTVGSILVSLELSWADLFNSGKK